MNQQMNVHAGIAVHTLALGLVLLCANSSHAGAESKPIVDVRFDAPYRQIDSSMGDEWAPTWGRDDVLYTSSDDGSSFGGVRENSVAFGALQGSDPNKLKATSLNGMRDFGESTPLGPEGAVWNAVSSYSINGVLYRWIPCGIDADSASISCLAVSSDQGKSWARMGGADQPLFNGTKFRAPSFIAYRGNYEAAYGNPGEYVYAAAYSGLIDGEDQYLVARVPAAKISNANAGDWSFLQTDYLQMDYSFTADLNSAQPISNSTHLGPDGGNWKAMNSYSVDGILYMFVTRCSYPSGSSDSKRRHIFQNSSIIKSTDSGRTWTRSGQENYNHPMFPGKRFGSPYFVWYGKDGSASVDNADRYVYAVSNNGYFENGDDYVLGRVLRAKLSHLSADDWTFYRTGDGMQEGSWTATLDQATPILTHPEKSSMTGMTYIPGLQRYVMVVWHYHRENFDEGIKEHDLGTVLEFFEAPKPWGPWNLVKTFDTGKLGWYAPIIGQRFQARMDSSSVKVMLYATGFFTRPEGGLDLALYKLNYMPITLSAKPLARDDTAFVGGR